MTTPTPASTRSTAPPTTIEVAERDRDWQATTDEAVARIDNALTIISTHINTVDDGVTRSHLTGQLTLALTILEQLADRLAAPAADDDEHPF